MDYVLDTCRLSPLILENGSVTPQTLYQYTFRLAQERCHIQRPNPCLQLQAGKRGLMGCWKKHYKPLKIIILWWEPFIPLKIHFLIYPNNLWSLSFIPNYQIELLQPCNTAGESVWDEQMFPVLLDLPPGKQRNEIWIDFHP